MPATADCHANAVQSAVCDQVVNYRTSLRRDSDLGQNEMRRGDLLAPSQYLLLFRVFPGVPSRGTIPPSCSLLCRSALSALGYNRISRSFGRNGADLLVLARCGGLRRAT